MKRKEKENKYKLLKSIKQVLLYNVIYKRKGIWIKFEEGDKLTDSIS